LKTGATEQAASWGNIPFGNSRVQVRHLVLLVGIALWLVPTIIATSIYGMVWFAFNFSFLLIICFVTNLTRSVSLHRLAICFFAGGLALGLTLLIGAPFFSAGSALAASPWRPFITVPLEEMLKLLPLLVLLFVGRSFSTWTLGATDMLLMGCALGAGFAFAEDAYSHARASAALSNLSVWLPSSELINGRVISGHGVWTGLATGCLGLAWLMRRGGFVWLALAPLGFLVSTVDHLALNYNHTAAVSDWVNNTLNFLSAGGYLPLILFLLSLLATTAVDLWLQFKSLPVAREFKLPSRKDRKESLQALWDCVLDLRRLCYAYCRYSRLEETGRPRALSLTVALLAKRLVNRYLAAEPVKVTIEGAGSPSVTLNIAGADLKSGLTIGPDTRAANGQDSGSSRPLTIRGPESGGRRGAMGAPPDFAKLGTITGPGPGFAADSAHGSDRLPTNWGQTALPDLPEQYLIEEEVSAGGMGKIYRGRHKHTGARLAIKIMHPHLSQNQKNLQRFEQEARTATTLQHPNIVVVYDFGLTPSHIPYLVMEWIDGTDLEPVVRRGGPLSVDRFIHIFGQCASALSLAHAKGVIHRDIKPSNIVLCNTPERPDFVKIVDFGIAKVLDDGDDISLTRTGDILGSPQFMSPEQCQGEPLDARSDIYSLGCVMYEALVGCPPFTGENAVQLMYKHVHEIPKQPRCLKPDLQMADILEPILFRALQKDPNRRYASMAELESELKRAQSFLPRK
jgi:tRNA A-37 threonylcarbamoyl transferase component Bud32